MSNIPIFYRKIKLNDITIHYRESGSTDKPTLLLLHGFPTSSHMFRDLIPRLSDTYHVVAPDYPGFGLSDAPGHQEFIYTFDSLADVLKQFVEALGLDKFAMYIFDYGAPVGLRLAVRHPEKVTAIISQNGNAYEEGLSDGWQPLRAYWSDPSQKNREVVSKILAFDATKFQYFEGVPDPSLVAPDGYLLDQYFLDRPGNNDIQLALMYDYRNNVAMYPDFQKYFRQSQVPLLAIWGKNDPYFIPAGAQAFKRDLPHTEVVLLDTGHFALETHCSQIATTIREFLR